MQAKSFTLFDTAIGACGVVWADRGVSGVYLPERDAAHTRARVLRRHPQAVEADPPEPVRQAIGRMTALLAGERDDLKDIAIDLEGRPEFFQRVWTAAREVPPGRTVTYGELAARIGDPGAARAVGEAMGKNPFPIVVPCHRVIGANGRTGGFSAPGGSKTKLRMLEIEGALAPETLPLFGG
jgi:methylated-DNA-[protein]-cysteine S-methyltransferase